MRRYTAAPEAAAPPDSPAADIDCCLHDAKRLDKYSRSNPVRSAVESAHVKLAHASRGRGTSPMTTRGDFFRHFRLTSRLPVAFSVFCALLWAVGAAPPMWQQFQNDPAHSGMSNFLGPQGPTVKTLWSFMANDEFINTAVIDGDGNVYAGAMDSTVYALNGTTGAKVWSYAMNASVPYAPLLEAGGHILLAGSSDGNVAAFMTATGSLRWSQQLGNVASLTASTLGTVVLPLSNSHNIVVDVATGATLWNQRDETYLSQGVAPAYDGNDAMFPCQEWCQYGCQDHICIITGLPSGSLGINSAAPGSPLATGSFDTTTGLFFLTSSGSISAYNGGTQIWQTSLSSTATAAPYSPAQVLVVSSTDGNIYGLNSTSGSTL